MKYNPDSSLMMLLTKLANLMILNLLFIVFSLPVLTVGAAWTALYAVAMKLVTDRQNAITTEFLRAFRQNLRQATGLWLGVLAAGALLLLDFRALDSLPAGTMAAALRVLVYLLAGLFLMLLQYLFPWLARFETTNRSLIKNAALAALAHLPSTLAMCAFSLLSVQLTLLNDYTMLSGVFIWLMLAFALLAVAKSCLLNPIFNRYMPAAGEEEGGAERE